MSTAQRTAYEAALRQGAPDYPPPLGLTAAELATAVSTEATRKANGKSAKTGT